MPELPPLMTGIDLTPGLNAMAKKPFLEQQYQTGQMQNQLVQKQLSSYDQDKALEQETARLSHSLKAFEVAMKIRNPKEQKAFLRQALPDIPEDQIPTLTGEGKDRAFTMPINGQKVTLKGDSDNMGDMFGWLSDNLDYLSDPVKRDKFYKWMDAEGIGMEVGAADAYKPTTREAMLADMRAEEQIKGQADMRYRPTPRAKYETFYDADKKPHTIDVSTTAPEANWTKHKPASSSTKYGSRISIAAQGAGIDLEVVDSGKMTPDEAKTLAESYKEMFGGNQLDDLMNVLRDNGSLPETDKPKPKGGADKVHAPKTQAEWDALPSNAVYIDPQDNKKYRKP